MKRVRVLTEAQPLDPVAPAVLLIDGVDPGTRPSTVGSTAFRVPTQTALPGGTGETKDVHVVLLRDNWSVGLLAAEIESGVLAAASRAGLEVDGAEIRSRAEAAARRELSPLRALGRSATRWWKS